jgi:hypothetical protein
MRSLALVSWALLAAGCGTSTGDRRGNRDGGSDAIPNLASISITPGGTTFTTTNGVAASGDFVATGTFLDGHTENITARVDWSLSDVGLGAIDDKAHYVSTTVRGGVGNVIATDGVKLGMAMFTLKWVTHRLATDDGSSPPADSATRFAGATPDPSLAPTLVYPIDRALVPRNLGELVVQWKRPAGVDLYEVSVVGQAIDLRVYTNATQPTQGGRLPLKDSEWTAVAETVHGGTVDVGVSGMASATPAKAGSAKAVKLTIGKDEVKGGIYYWAAKGAGGAVEGIYRHAFGDHMSAAKAYYTIDDGNKAINDGKDTHCVACHALSRDGKKFALTYDGGGGPGGLLDVATKGVMIAPNAGVRWNFASFSPDGSKLVVATGGTLKLIDTSGGVNTGKAIADVPTGGWGTHPDWSPDGHSIVFVRNDSSPGTYDWEFVGGTILVSTETGGVFGAPQVLVTAQNGENNYYPSFSPDSKWIVFNRSKNNAYDDPDATLMVVAAVPNAQPIALALANATGNLTNSWPRWSPFVQKNGEHGDLFYFTFSSKRDYGIEMGSLNPANPNRPQIWMAAFDPAVASGSADPSHAPFWLPFQNIQTNNHIAQWAEQIVGIQ